MIVSPPSRYYARVLIPDRHVTGIYHDILMLFQSSIVALNGSFENHELSVVVFYSLLNASIGSMFDAFHAGYSPDITHTTIPITIPYGTYIILSGMKK